MQWYFIVLLGTIVNALFVVITKKTLLKEHSIEFSSAISFLMLVISLPLLFFIDVKLRPGQIAIVYVISALFTIAFVYNMKAIRHMDVSVVAPLSTFTTAITAILAVIFLKEEIKLMQAAGILLLLAGAYVLQAQEHMHNLVAPFKKLCKSRYIGYLFTALFFFSCAFLLIRFIVNSDSSYYIKTSTFVLLLHVFISLNFFTITTLFYRGLKTYDAGLKSLKMMVLLAILLVFYRLLQFTAISIPTAKIAFVMALSEMYVFFVVLIGGRMFHENGMKRKAIGTVIMVIGVLVIIFGGS